MLKYRVYKDSRAEQLASSQSTGENSEGRIVDLEEAKMSHNNTPNATSGMIKLPGKRLISNVYS